MKIPHSGKPGRSKNSCGAWYGIGSNRPDALFWVPRSIACLPARYEPPGARELKGEPAPRVPLPRARRQRKHARRTPLRRHAAAPARSLGVPKEQGKLGRCAAWSLPRKRPLLYYSSLDAVVASNVTPNSPSQFPRPAGLSRHPGLCYNRMAVKHTGQQEVALAAARGVVVGESGSSAQSASETSTHPQEDASRYCPVCSQRLESRRCKLVCNVCGYYMSCADYY